MASHYSWVRYNHPCQVTKGWALWGHQTNLLPDPVQNLGDKAGKGVAGEGFWRDQGKPASGRDGERLAGWWVLIVVWKRRSHDWRPPPEHGGVHSIRHAQWPPRVHKQIGVEEKTESSRDFVVQANSSKYVSGSSHQGSSLLTWGLKLTRRSGTRPST